MIFVPNTQKKWEGSSAPNDPLTLRQCSFISVIIIIVIISIYFALAKK